MGNQCGSNYCVRQEYNDSQHTPLVIFQKIVKIQSIVRGFLAKRYLKVLKSNYQYIKKERELLNNLGWTKLNSILTPKLLKTGNICITYLNNNTAYVGQIQINNCSKDQNIPHGIGRLIMIDAYKEGSFNKGELIKGIYYFNNITLSGTFQNGLLNGRGKAIYQDGSIYEGSFDKGIKNGFGKMIDSKGNIYEGQFYNGLMNGEGEYCGKDGRYYLGEWVNGQYHGNGELLFPDGSKYIGQFSNNQRHGQGQYITQYGNCIGQWKNGKFCQINN